VTDSQSIKTSAVREESKKGFDMGKKIWARKRHTLVDTQGNLMEVKATVASASDLAGGKKLLEPLRGRFPGCSFFGVIVVMGESCVNGSRNNLDGMFKLCGVWARPRIPAPFTPPLSPSYQYPNRKTEILHEKYLLNV